MCVHCPTCIVHNCTEVEVVQSFGSELLTCVLQCYKVLDIGQTYVWLLKLNVDKCKVVSYGRQVEKNKYVMVQNNCTVELQRDAYVKDLGVVFDEKLNFSQHISEIINKAYSMLWLIRRNFQHIV